MIHTQAQGQEAEKRLTRFFIDVIIPLAESTYAVIFVDAIRTHCMLSAAMSQALEATRAK